MRTRTRTLVLIGLLLTAFVSTGASLNCEGGNGDCEVFCF